MSRTAGRNRLFGADYRWSGKEEKLAGRLAGRQAALHLGGFTQGQRRADVDLHFSRGWRNHPGVPECVRLWKASTP